MNVQNLSDSLIDDKKRLLLEKLKGKSSGSQHNQISQRQGGGRIPLSFAQRRLWFLDQMVPGSAAYNVAITINLKGRMDFAILQQSVDAMVMRHDVLRTTIGQAEGEAWQEIAGHGSLPVLLVDLRHLVEGQDAALQADIAQRTRIPFDLEKGPIFRLTAYRLADEQQVILLLAHHIAIDGWSLGLFWQELLRFYDAFAAGQSSPFAPLAIQYADFSEWQSRELSDLKNHPSLQYWREKLADVEPSDLPLDHPRPPVQSFMGDDFVFAMPVALRQKLADLCKSKGVSLFAVLLAALQVMLHRYTGQNRIAVGSPVSNRTRVEIEPLIGLFVNTLVYKADIDGNQRFVDFLKDVRESVTEAQAHQDVPFEAVVEAVAPERYLSMNPLFQVCLNLLPLRNMPATENFTIEDSSGVRNGGSKFDLWIGAIDQGDQLLIEVEFNSVVFEQSTVRRMMDSWQTLLEAVAQAPEKPIRDLPVLDAAARRLVIETWNDTHRAYPDAHRPLHDLITAQCDRTPSATALVFGDERLTYAGLKERAGKLAAFLVASGVRANDIVGLYLQRSLELVVAIQGVMRAGAAYLPLDPSYPAARIEAMVDDARPPVVLTTRALRQTLPDTAARIIVLDDDWPAIAATPALSDEPRGGDLAYLIYTSGSTGRPKGVLNTHAGIVNRLLWMQEAYHLTPDDKVLHKTPFGFDVSVWELCWPLMVGATMVIAAPDRHADPDYLGEIIERQGVTTLHFVPSILEIALARPGFASRCGSLRQVMCSGEALPATLARQFFSSLQHCALHNLYGPTEAAVDVTYWACSPDDDVIVPIGRPVANTSIYILDGDLKPVPVGVIGELYIGGVQVAKGYLNRPDLTRERFLPDPFRNDHQGQMYRTGDLARFRADGVIEYRGRMDSQIKLRGVRIELGEIEAALESHDKVRQAAVIVHQDDDDPASKRLIAFAVVSDGSDTSDDGIDDWQATFDMAYADGPQAVADDDHLGGWKSSFNGEDFPPEVMRDYLDATVQRILARKPQRVLEIGVGTGLIMRRVAPYCQAYLGTDISKTGLSFIQQRLVEQQPELAHVVLKQAAADDLAALGDEHFDLVVFNSVVQYFPDLAYLNTVLTGLLDRLSPGGAIYMGDIRNLETLPDFQAELEMSRLGPNARIADLKRRLSQHAEKELVIDPCFFSRLKQEEPRIGHLEVELRRGRRSDEMTRFRYDVTLVRDVQTAEVPQIQLVWGRDIVALDQIEHHLAHAGDQLVAVLGITNERLALTKALMAALNSADDSESLADLSYRIWGLRALNGDIDLALDPESWWLFAQRRGWRAVVAPMPKAVSGDYAVVLLPPGRSVQPISEWPQYGHLLSRPSTELATTPARNRTVSVSTGQLRSYLADRLPSHMCPASFVLVPAFPVTSNGKLNRGALHALVPPPEDRSAIRRAPQTATEKALSEVWSEVLGVDVLDAEANFFELGGDSIRSVQVVSKALNRGIELTPQMIFRYDSLAALATIVDKTSESVPAATIPIVEAGHALPVAVKADTVPDAAFGQVVDSYALTPFQTFALHYLLKHRTPGLFQVHRCTTVATSSATEAVFRRALREQIATHPILRTAFDWSGDVPRQIVYDTVEEELVMEDWRSRSPSEQDAALEAYLEADRQRGIEPETPGAMRYFLAEIDNETSLCVMSFSFLCLDGWSYNLLTDELLERLDALNNGRPYDPPAAMAFRRFVEHVNRQDLDAARRYWLERTSGFERTARLPCRDRATLPSSTVRYARQFVSLVPSVSLALRDAAKQRHVPLNAFFQAAWSAVIAAMTGNIDVVHGVLLAGRSSGPSGVETMVGPSLSILPLRNLLEPTRPLGVFLAEVLNGLVELSQHELIGLDKALDWAQLPPLTPPSQSYLVFQNVGTHNSERFGAGYFFSKLGYPLRVDVFPTEAISLHISYDQTQFDDQSVAGLLAAFRAVVERLAAHSTGTVSTLLEIAQASAARAKAGAIVREGAARISDVRAASAV
ncbi:non-ribosomal peptide synthetase [Rhizobium sp.]|jgi:amino acid adenylation domain-containing protein|uniref:non-ribosomal peptide synthetase n=1 Tax=Rhizobium sp. TaxID=391 RepID=UPI000E9327F7|nr:non-ribosomal peptide synthetase [Rhizobium sp.]